MNEIIIAGEIYLLAIIISVLVAFLIKIMMGIIRLASPKKVAMDSKNKASEGK
ncbi:MAG: hypothetical protein PHV71_00295 [Eubacteriales bacterium]|nr:hypothetical protein [Eubacteriales bacterium]MDD4122050.1 hypothetical protein [Eubacteriales bacterium]MDD4629025.1 hypothetical protein [Eubacteriales bacterium]